MDKGTKQRDIVTVRSTLREATEMGWGLGRPDQENCSHSKTITISTSGLDRNVCEMCGHVSMTFTSDLEGDIDRNVFARQADEPSQDIVYEAQPIDEPQTNGGTRKQRFGFMAGSGSRGR